MTVHLMKLCVGVDSVDDLEAWIAQRQQIRALNGEPLEQIHTTRMNPKRRDEILDGGSLYWVMKGEVRARQRLIDIEEFVDEEGVKRCRLVLDDKIVRTQRRGRRPFQGWRYLKDEDTPADAKSFEGDEMPAEMRAELEKLGLL